MDNLQPQSGGVLLPEGHDDSDLNIRGVVWFGAFLAVGGVVAFVLVGFAMWGLEKWEREHEAKLSPVQQSLQAERDRPRDREATAVEGEVGHPPDWFGGGDIDKRLGNTFVTPRLQYNDDQEMSSYRESESHWLESTGKSSDGSIHIPIDRAMELLVQQGLPPVSGPFLPANASAPSAAIPNGGVEPLPARANPGAKRGGAKP